MKNKKELEENLGNLYQLDIENLKETSKQLEEFTKSPEISEKGLRQLDNTLGILEAFRKSYSWRIIRLLKQGNMLD